MEQKIKDFESSFIKDLSEFVKGQKEIAKVKGINKEEVLAIISIAFNLLGQNHLALTKKANFK